jgi:hypothetical protein
MPASAAQIAANQKNAQLSTGPKTVEGKEQSRANAYKHGLTGSGTVLPEREAIEVERRTQVYASELKPTTEIALALVRRVALLSVRMDRSVEVENLRLTYRVRQAEAEFVPPEGCDPATADRLRFEAGKLALADPSREAKLAHQYENAAERGFYRALKELRQMEKAEKAEKKAELDGLTEELLASFAEMKKLDDEFDAMYADESPATPKTSPKMAKPSSQGGVDVPFSIGRGR